MKKRDEDIKRELTRTSYIIGKGTTNMVKTKESIIQKAIISDLKKVSEKEAAEFIEKAKLQGQIAIELNSLINIDPQKVKSVFKKYQKMADSIMKESPRLPDTREVKNN